MNHQSNQVIIPLIMEQMSEIKPYPAGQRLLKLLCSDLNDLSIYKDWKKLASGAYGTIFSCNTDLADPKDVAIKMMSFPESIFDRSVLHDIFSEITSMEYFRLNSCVVNIYDFGVWKNEYYIVMKKYESSLRTWRLKEDRPIKRN
jgi:serine/threonine protein kinase